VAPGGSAGGAANGNGSAPYTLSNNASSDSLQHVSKQPRVGAPAVGGPAVSSTTSEHLTGVQFSSLGLSPNTQR